MARIIAIGRISIKKTLNILFDGANPLTSAVCHNQSNDSSV